MTRYEIWREGYATTGLISKAGKMGELDADSFQQACDTLLGKHEAYVSSQLTYWGCRLFETEAAARKAFG